MQKFELMATCASGIEALVGRELRDLGYDVQVENGRVRFEGTIEDILRTNLWLRTADRVKIIVSEFEAKTFDDLFELTKKVSWDKLLPIDASFPVEGRSRNSQLHSVPDAQAIVKKAIVNQLSETYHRRTRLPETGAVYPLEVAINKDQVQLTLDTTGDSLFKRGYRIGKGGAPMKENMAAALVMLTSWKSDMPFVDPVCGSGTIAIEAALIGQNIAPGFNRNFICEKWDWVPASVSEQLRDEADEKADYDAKLDITGYDIDQNMVDIAKKNAIEAGLGDVVSFKQLAVKDFKTDKLNGVIVANPPYGQRLSDQQSVRKLYREMGQTYKPLSTWSKYILTSDLEFEQFYGSRSTKRRKLYNGALRTDLFQYWGKPIWHHDGKREKK
ncbi:class I SAM-dependent RNA methyltransferase [Pediococcus inopinatus]|uniref:Class I SAM-dependent RNA methyltransferase n=1 Tax=Pediococcus inopinatus TaxID=114090 RepID=A0ABZ0Q177_9LACO|nr:class I SAM-dependent RNA methyltransferase [Pediococcus inopinatus]WPC18975.1 class I SAM-dependent RNA methyltransferase [Pediococcus inopinatus]WPC20711.1 class I SAM-dependent RNA methyltransferase [Pediococcus inopinatus]WPP08422.1 class I SAM-dependent RNA methyltransferase [Pediococcus inopinatus]